MGKIIRLTESDLYRLVKKVIKEQELEFQQCVQNFGSPINMKFQGKTYLGIKGSGDWDGWVFFKGDTAWSPVQNKVVNFFCRGKYIVLQKKEDVSSGNLPGVTEEDSDSSVITNSQKVIKLGSSGPLVKIIQSSLSRLNDGDPVKVGGNIECKNSLQSCDGKFGSGTKEAVKSFQKRMDLTPDGIIGKQVWQLMYVKNASKTDVIKPKTITKQSEYDNMTQKYGKGFK
jgi:hypothetical protein